MNYNRIYESAQTTEDVLHSPYIMDSEEESYIWDFDSMKDNIHNSSPEYWEGMEEYKDIDEYDSLAGWWKAHYDPKGLAMSYDYHDSIYNDVEEMIAKYNKKCVNHYHTPLTEIIRDSVDTNTDTNEEEAIIIIGVNGSLIEEGGQYCSSKEVFEDEVLYNYNGAPVKEAYYDEDSGTFIMVWDLDILKTGAL